MRARLATAGILAALTVGVFAAPASATTDPRDGYPQSIRNEQTGRCLDSDSQGKVYTKPCTSNNPYQQWNPTSVNRVNLWTFRNVATGLCVTRVSDTTVRAMICAGSEYAPQTWDFNTAARTNALLNVSLALDSDSDGNVYLRPQTQNNRYQSWLFGYIPATPARS
ncbi:RICIN domain-containing protein [Streptomyces sp. WELS2]|uniref:RICIN domain-containing protein n=1 Tax=Streptomyces sp. WELS2 TaxID=2749435 RepID=UPI0015EFF349|nr:RICIN domain-containing protein [Streptomyces sp. WELS2]